MKGIITPEVHTYKDVVHQLIWNNKNISVQKLSVFEKQCFSEGIVTVGDLLSDGGVFLKGANLLNANLSPLQRFKLMSMMRSLVNGSGSLDKVHSTPLHILVPHFI